MPKLSARLISDIKRYIALRFDHNGDVWVKARIKKVVKALKKESKEVQERYSDNVNNFFEINQSVIEDAKRAKIMLDDPAIPAILNMPSHDVAALVKKHGGNINAVVDEINGNNNQQHQS